MRQPIDLRPGAQEIACHQHEAAGKVRSLLDHLFHRRGLDARPELVDWIAARIERSHLAVERTVDVIDQATMERRARLTIPLARAVLADAALIAVPPEES